MRAVVQRVSSASVAVDGRVVGQIGRGLLALVGIAPADGAADVQYIAHKLAELRIFPDGQGRMNRSVVEIGGAPPLPRPRGRRTRRRDIRISSAC